jgi:hypothetical protein
MSKDKKELSLYNKNYWDANKATIMEKRRLQRADMSPDQGKRERAKAKECARRKRRKMTELIDAATELLYAINAQPERTE